MKNTVTTKKYGQKLVLVTDYVNDDLGRVLEQKTTTKKVTTDGTEEKTSKELFQYDFMGNVIEKTTCEQNNSEQPFETHTEKMVYDNQSRMISSYDEKGVKENYATLYSYDLNNRLVKTAVPISKKDDVMGNATSFQIKIGGKEQFSSGYDYDEMSRLSKVNVVDDDKTSKVADYTYDANGNLASATMTTPNIKTTYSYDLANEVTQAQTMQGADYSKRLSEFNVTYYDNGQKKSESSFVSGTEKEANVSYEYDAMGRLTKESKSGQDALVYSYDANNNRSKTTQGNTTTAYQYNKNDELLRTDELNTSTLRHKIQIYKTDNNGNEVGIVNRRSTEEKKPVFDLDVSLGDNQLNDNVVNHYNAMNQLTRSLTKNTKVAYQYSADGLRSTKTVNGKTTKYIWDGDQLVMELDDDYKVSKRYISGNSLLYSDEGRGTEKTYYVTNTHGDVVQLVDSKGDVIKTYEYDSFGNEVNPDKKDMNPLRYGGEYYDKETGTMYLRARYYNPDTGRFITQDSYTGEDDDSLSLNRYTFCENDPVVQMDYNGNFPDLLSLFKYAVKQRIRMIKKGAAVTMKMADIAFRTSVKRVQKLPIYKIGMNKFTQLTQSGKLNKALKLAGFVSEIDKTTNLNVYHTTWGCLQRFAGYNNFYDYVFDAVTSMDKNKVEFSNKKYVLWMWKGNYLNQGAGGEVGIYRQLKESLCYVDRDYALKMTLSLARNGRLLYDWSPSHTQWWITGFVPSVQGVRQQELTLSGTVKFSSNKTRRLWEDFEEGCKEHDEEYVWKNIKKPKATFVWKR